MTIPGYWRSPIDPERVMHVSVTHWEGDERQEREDHLAVEEPFEIRINDQSLAMIMRTPGNDVELSMGFLFTEGVIADGDEVREIESAVDADGLPLANVVNVRLRSRGQEAALVSQPVALQRHFAISASCGLCGKNSITDLLVTTPPLERDEVRISAEYLYKLPEQLRRAQAVFISTGGLHAAGLFRSDGELLLLREDVGRHNAVDKVIGHGLLQGNILYKDYILMVSGRTSFEIIEKALLARIPCIAAISAPSSLAVELADQCGITLVGFLRERAMNVYTHPERVV